MTFPIPSTVRQAINRPFELLSIDPKRCLVHEVLPLKQNRYNTLAKFRVYPKGVDVTTDDLTGLSYRLKRVWYDRTELTEQQLSTAYYMASVPDIAAIVDQLNSLYASGQVLSSDFEPVEFDLSGTPGTMRRTVVKTSKTSLYYHCQVGLDYLVP